MILELHRDLINIFRDKYQINPVCIEIDKKILNFLNKVLITWKIFQIYQIKRFYFSSNVLEHIKNDLKILISIRRQLKETEIYICFSLRKRYFGLSWMRLLGITEDTKF